MNLGFRPFTTSTAGLYAEAGVLRFNEVLWKSVLWLKSDLDLRALICCGG